MILRVGLFTTAAVLVVLLYPLKIGIPSKCPSGDELQSIFVKKSYSEEKHQGLYYEIAFKDVTQPRMCKCITSNKTIVSNDTLQDDFYIQCSGEVHYANLSFHLNVDRNKRGYMIGRWNDFGPFKGVSFPNYIVDVGVDPSSGEYEWVIEFQCIQGKKIFGRNWIEYYGLNFYSKTYNDPTLLGTMESAARRRGLGPFLDNGLSLFPVDHTGCLQDHPVSIQKLQNE